MFEKDEYFDAPGSIMNVGEVFDDRLSKTDVLVKQYID